MKIKICGFTQRKNAYQAALLGVDAIGLVFYEKSPRFVDIKTAVQIVDSLPPFVNRVGLFVNAPPVFVNQVISKVALDTLQFHGDELADECAQYTLPFIKVLRVVPKINISKKAEEYHRASGLMLDSFNQTSYGGSGESFDWDLANVDVGLPIILAGGLNADNVAEAIAQASPYGVDVSSGVESAKGVKDIDKIKQFILKAR